MQDSACLSAALLILEIDYLIPSLTLTLSNSDLALTFVSVMVREDLLSGLSDLRQTAK